MTYAKKFQQDRDHPILDGLVDHAEKESPECAEFFKSSVIYVSPRTIALIFGSCEPEGEHDFANHLSTTLPSLEEVDGQELMVSVAASYFENELAEFNVLLDYRGVRYLDWVSVQQCLSTLQSARLEGFALTVRNGGERPSGIPKNRVFETVRDVHRQLTKSLVSHGKIELQITIKSRLTLRALEGADFPRGDEKLKAVSRINVNCEDLTGVTPFGLFSLRMALESFYLRYGAVASIRAPSSPRVFEQMMLGGFEDLPKTAFNVIGGPDENAYSLAKVSDFCYSMRKGESRVELLQKIENVIGKLFRQYDKMKEFRSTKYVKPHSSFSPAIRRLQVRYFISTVLLELTENAVLYSRGPLRVSISDRGGLLSICVGDLGVGLRHGILQNYEMHDTLNSNKATLKHAFSLPKFIEKRKDKERLENAGAGFGLYECLLSIFRCDGRLIFRTGDVLASYVNPVSRASRPTSTAKSKYFIRGTQYMVLIPLNSVSLSKMPKTFYELMEAGL